MRFARLRMEKRHNYVRKVAETAVQLFISNDKARHSPLTTWVHELIFWIECILQPNITGMILAGSADFKTELSQSDMFDPVSQLLL